MTLVKGTLGTGDTEIFSACDPVITKPAIYRRSCAFGPVKKLWIGYRLRDDEEGHDQAQLNPGCAAVRSL